MAEKSRQVAMIGRIFQQATRVRVWVGEHADNSELLFQPPPPINTGVSGALDNDKNRLRYSTN